MKRLFAVLALVACLPAAAQDVAATLRVTGDVRITSGTDFVAAVDRQPVIVGQRIMVGEGASAKIQYSADCVRSYTDPGVYTVQPARCDRDRKRKDERTDGSQGSELAGGSTAGTIGTILGTVLLGQQTLEHRKDRAPDRALSH
jgi:hypothetical protein